jgi:hypothetical protein
VKDEKRGKGDDLSPFGMQGAKKKEACFFLRFFRFFCDKHGSAFLMKNMRLKVFLKYPVLRGCRSHHFQEKEAGHGKGQASLHPVDQ